jgi:hypothetical protein
MLLRIHSEHCENKHTFTGILLHMEYITLRQSQLNNSYRRYCGSVHVYCCTFHHVKLGACHNWPHLYRTNKIILVYSWPAFCILTGRLSCSLTLTVLGRPRIDFRAFCCLNPEIFTFKCWMKSISGNILHTFDVKYMSARSSQDLKQNEELQGALSGGRTQYKIIWVKYVVTRDINWKILELC